MKVQGVASAGRSSEMSGGVDSDGVSFRFGPVVQGNAVLFQLWAPDASVVSVRIGDRAPVGLKQDGEGFWKIWCKAAPGDLYKYEIDGRLVPDPASRFQPEDTGGPSQIVAPNSYTWKNRYWHGRPWEESVFYEAHVGVCGGYDGVRRRLPELASLGVTAVELMPIGDFRGERNWGYDGVMPFAPDCVYGTPDELRALVDEAHGLGMMMFLDVVYNHFGPEGNYLPAFASRFFDEATQTPWGAVIDYHQTAVRRFFTENALYWLQEFRFDGLRLDAVHAIADRSWLTEMAAEVRAGFQDRHVHLVLENESNDAALLGAGFNAQWNDDFHNVMHVLLTGETHAYYADFAERPARKLARCLAEGFIYQGEGSPNHGGRPRGQKSGHLPPTSFVTFLQNHDQVGNRALGERLTVLAPPEALRAAMALMLLCPQIPLLFMGEENGAREPFLFFTDFQGELADAVREGRRKEFAKSPGFADAHAREAIPDPNASRSFEASRWSTNAADAHEWYDYMQDLISLRRRIVVPGLRGARALGADVLGEAAVQATWRMGNGTTLILASNLGADAIPMARPDFKPVFGSLRNGDGLPGMSTLAWLVPAP